LMLLPEEERKRMGKNGRNLVAKKFNVDRVIQQYDSILRAVLGDRTSNHKLQTGSH